MVHSDWQHVLAALVGSGVPSCGEKRAEAACLETRSSFGRASDTLSLKMTGQNWGDSQAYWALDSVCARP